MAFESLSDKLQNIFKNLRGKGRLSEADVKAALKEVKMALLEADVSFKVVKQFISSIQERAVGEEVFGSLTPGQTVIKIVTEELIRIREAVEVYQTLLVVDAMTGQDAVNVAGTFNDKVGIDGVILTKLDGDTRGGAALSIRSVTGKPILYIGMGEKLSDLEQFYPDRMASRILGMGDIQSLIEKAAAEVDEEQAKELSQKLRKAEFDYNDFLSQMQQIKKMGGMGSILSMMPGMGSQLAGVDMDEGERSLRRVESIILSMTKEERANPGLMNPSRKQRIAKGAGVDVSEVNRLVKQFDQMKKMMKQMPGLMGGGKRKGFGGLGSLMGGKLKLPF